MYQSWYIIYVYFLVQIQLTKRNNSRILNGTERRMIMPVSYEKLFLLMQDKGIKKVDLRNKYKINPKTVDSLVNNRSVTVDTIMQLCEIFDCQPGDLMEYIKEDTVQ